MKQVTIFFTHMSASYTFTNEAQAGDVLTLLREAMTGDEPVLITDDTGVHVINVMHVIAVSMFTPTEKEVAQAQRGKQSDGHRQTRKE